MASGSVPVRYGRARQALVDATVELSGRVGFHGLTVAELSVAAGVGPRTFYNHFADLSDVFFEACWQLHEELREAIQAAYEGAVVAPDVRDAAVDVRGSDSGDRCGSRTRCEVRVRACVEAVVAFVQADPVRARALFVEGHAGGSAVVELRAETVGWLVGLVVGETTPGGAEASSGPGSRSAGMVDEPGSAARPDVSRLSAEFAVGGINAVLRTRINADDLEDLTDLIPAFVDTLMRARRDIPARPRIG